MNRRTDLRIVARVCAMCVSTCLPAITMGDDRTANVSRHLGVVGRVNLGSFYTPAKYVSLVGGWLLSHGVGKGWTIADLSCGYGAFFELAQVDGLHECRYVGNDIDHEAIATASALFPHVVRREVNALHNVSRERFGLSDDERIVVVGNPPYNDVTSQINRKIKTKALPIDEDIRTRDLGMSSLLMYAKIQADYVAVLHPLSYLVKKANYTALRRFFSDYSIQEHVVFSSQEFAGTSKIAAFPVIVALYRRQPYQGLSYDKVLKMHFKTTEGNSFSLSGFDFVADEIEKYPSGRRYDPEILFYTLRDINALRRSRTFLSQRISNAIDVDPTKLSLYCYIDCFKRYATVPYYMGNFNVPYIKSDFVTISNDVVAIARHAHPEVFGRAPKPTDEMEARVKDYIERSLKGKEPPHDN